MSPETLTPLFWHSHVSSRLPARLSFSEKGQCCPSPCRRKQWRRKAFAGWSTHPGSALSRQGSIPRTEYTGQERKTTWLFGLSCRTFPLLGFRNFAIGEEMKRLIPYPYYPACQAHSMLIRGHCVPAFCACRVVLRIRGLGAMCQTQDGGRAGVSVLRECREEPQGPGAFRQNSSGRY